MTEFRAHDSEGLRAAGVEYVRVSYPDLHGVCRSKDIPVEAFDAIRERGMSQTEAVMTIDLRHNIVSGFEHGFRDFEAVPDVGTLVRLPHDPTVAWCLADGRAEDGGPFGLDPRAALRRQVDALAEHGLHAVAGPELEFYLVHREGLRPYVEHPSSVYTCGPVADPRGAQRAIVDVARDLGLRPIAATQEYGRGQYEINLAHSAALDAADRAFRFKATAKDVAAGHGLLATFLGQMRDDDEGSGFHLHVSLQNSNGANAFAEPAAADGLSSTARAFAAGILAHLPGMTAFLNPTVNAYRRFIAESLAPTHVNWGLGTRLATLRFPVERGQGTRVELRSADGTANPYLLTAAVLAAGREGIELRLELGPPAPDNPYAAADGPGEPLPTSLRAALDALRADERLWAAMGPELCETFVAIKGYELDRWDVELRKVTDWEREEYAHHL